MYRITSVIIMAFVTYFPRAIPIAFCKKEIKNKFVKSFLLYVPYAVLAALTFPFVFYSTSSPLTASVGVAIALVLALCNCNLVVVAIGAILGVLGASYIF
jgi:branched-subunit amino acid transport protein